MNLDNNNDGELQISELELPSDINDIVLNTKMKVVSVIPMVILIHLINHLPKMKLKGKKEDQEFFQS